MPLQVRYAAEARPYALAVLFAVGATLLVREMDREPSAKLVVCYIVTLCLGMWTQPYFVFVPVAHLTWAALVYGIRSPLPTRLAISASLMMLFYLPWYFETQGVLSSPEMKSDLSVRTLLVLFREFTGGGYAVALAIVICAGLALKARQTSRKDKLFWLLLACIPIVGPLTADYVFGRFFAARQIIFAIPAVACLSGTGLQASGKRKVLLMGAVCVLMLAYDVHYFFKPQENWEQASLLLSSTLRRTEHACVIFVPEDSARYYLFFNPELSKDICRGLEARSGPALIAISPYGGMQQYERMKSLRRRGRAWRETVLRTWAPEIVRVN